MEINKQAFVQIVKARLKEVGWRQGDLGEYIGLAPASCIAKLCNGDFSAKQIAAIMDVLDIDPSEVEAYDNTPSEPKTDNRPTSARTIGQTLAETLAANVNRTLNERGMTIDELAEKLKCSPVGLKKAIRHNKTTMDLVERIAKELSVNSWELLTRQQDLDKISEHLIYEGEINKNQFECPNCHKVLEFYE